MNFKSTMEEDDTPVVIEQPKFEKEKPKATATTMQVSQDDLFSAHDFDIKIDLEVPSKYFLKTFEILLGIEM